MTMVDPFRLIVVKALTSALKEITPANGYQHDLSDTVSIDGTIEKVIRGRTIFGSNDPLPMLAIFEPPIPPDGLPAPEDARSGKYTLELIVQGFVKDDPTHPTDPAQYLLADVKKRLAKERTRKRGNQSDPLGLGPASKTSGGNVITELRIGYGVVRPADGISSQAYFWLPVSISLVENVEDPFT